MQFDSYVTSDVHEDMARVLIKHVAAEAMLSVSCTARALKGIGGIPNSTCRRVREIADRLGYRPDPMLTALSAYCRAGKPARYHCTLAFLTTRSNEQTWLRNQENGDLLRGARARADSLGFRVDFINIGPTRKAQLQAWAVMQARGIRGAMIRSLPMALADLYLPFEKFACIDLFSAPMGSELPTVSSYHAQSMELILGEIAQRGYQHPALVVGERLSEYLHHGWRMVFQVHSTRFSQASLYLHENEVIDFPRLSLWARERKVDALIFGISENFLPKKVRTRYLEGMGLVCMDLVDPHCGLSGIYQDRPRGGAVAVDWLQSMLITADAGATKLPNALMIPGVWKEGFTLPTRRREAV